MRKHRRHTCIAFVPYKTTERRFSLPALGMTKSDAREKFVRDDG